MKRRTSELAELAETPSAVGEPTLCEALAALTTREEVRAFLEDLCTPAEMEALADRWRVVPLLLEGLPYREIHDRTSVSVTTVGRVARCLALGSGGYRLAAERIGLSGPQQH
jgi:TrpR-related protein YerC/YecD